MISVKSLRVDYEDIHAVHDLDLDISEGQIYGLVGPNGAGKTSTIKAIARIIEPTYGDVKLHGIDMQIRPEKAWKKLGYMPDFSPVYDNLKVWEYLEVFAVAHFLSQEKKKTQTRYWIGRLGLETKTDAYIRDLSRGMRQRLAFAKTLIHEPSILLLDEPASGMDPLSRIDLREILKELSQKGVTTLISSHILTELSDFCTAIGIMEKGRLVVSGALHEVRERIGAQQQIIIKLLPGTDETKKRLMDMAEKSEFLSGIEEKSNEPWTFQGSYTGDDDQAHGLLSQMTANGLRVCEFHRKQDDIQDIFLKIGAREIS
jgi:ABC-2 type transport system ATP-binding protein